MRRRILLVFALLTTLAPLCARAQDSEAVPPPGTSTDLNAVVLRLADLKHQMAEKRDELAALRRSFKTTPDDVERKAISAKIAKVDKQVADLSSSLEQVAAGNLDLAVFDDKPAEDFDWKGDVEEILRPIVLELKRLTDRPRTIERLRSERQYYEARVPVARDASERFALLASEVDDGSLRKDLIDLSQKWKRRQEDLQNQLDMVDLHLDRLLHPTGEDRISLADDIRRFFSGRGLNLLLAAVGFMTTYAGMSWFGRLVAVAGRRRSARRHFLSRAAILTFQVATVIAALTMAASILYVRGDWLIMGLIIIFVIGIGWALRQSIPRYLKEARILLNLGPVREGERVVYNGIPWQITSLSIYSTLHNPLLEGATIRLSIDEMARLHSRPFGQRELWFPTKESDYVMLDGDVFGKVSMQTPEVVQLLVMGSIKNYSIGDFLSANPRNLSQSGFAVAMTFGIDYQHQPQVTTTIEEQFRAWFKSQMAGKPFYSRLTDLNIEFSEAASSSLNFVVVAVFSGEAADQYWAIRRTLQRTAVEACNAHGWVIPFNQITVHTQSAPGAAAAA